MSKKDKNIPENGEAIALDIPAEEISAPTLSDINDLTQLIVSHRRRANRYGLEARLFAGIGSFVCVLAVAAYAILSLPSVMNIPFEWKYIYITAGAWVLFLLLGCAFGIAKWRNEKIVKTLKKARANWRSAAEATAEEAPIAEEAPVEEAEAIELGECTEEEAAEPEAQKSNPVMEKLRAQIDRLPEKIKSPVNKAIDKVSALPKKAVVGAGSAAAALIVAAGTAKAIRKKKKNKSKKSAIHGTFTVNR